MSIPDSSSILSGLFIEHTTPVHPLKSSTEIFLDALQAWQSQALDKPTILPAVSEEAIARLIQKFALAFDFALNAAKEGSAAASDGLTLSQDFALSRMKRGQQLTTVIDISKAGLERSQKALKGFQDVNKEINKVLSEQIKDGTHDRKAGRPDAIISVIDKFGMLIGWYIFWWSEKMMEEDCQKSRLEAQKAKRTRTGINIVKIKWEVLKDNYSTYAEQMHLVRQEYVDIFNSPLEIWNSLRHGRESADATRGEHNIITAAPTYPEPESLVDLRLNIRDQGSEYTKAVDLSLAVAQDGSSLCDEMIYFADVLQPHNGDQSQEDLHELYLGDMYDSVNKAVEDAAQVNSTFANLRQKVEKVLLDVRKEIETSERKHVHELQRAQKRLEYINTCIESYESNWLEIHIGVELQERLHNMIIHRYSPTSQRGIVAKWKNLRNEYVAHAYTVQSNRNINPTIG